MARRGIELMAGVAVAALMASNALAAQSVAPAAQSGDGTQDGQKTIVVTGKAPAVIHKVDRTIYDLKDNPQAETGTVGDVLNTLPAVSVSPDGTVTVRGEGSVQILIDGKPATALRGANRANALQSMNANTISKIEVVTNPGAQFRSDSGAVINIVTKKNMNRGGSGDITLNMGPENRYNGSLSGTYGVGKLTLNGGISFRQDGRKTISHTDRTQTSVDGDPVSALAEDYLQRNRVNAGTLDAGVNYAVSDDDSLSLSTSVAARRFNRHVTDRIRIYDDTNALDSDTTTLSSGPQHQNEASLTGSYKHKGKREGETFTLTLLHDEVESGNDRYYDPQDTITGAPGQDYQIGRHDRNLTDEVSGDYVLPLSGDKQWTAGFDIEDNRIQSYNYANDIDAERAGAANDRFLIQQTLSAGYVTYQAPVGKWTVQGGLRVENMLTRSRPDRATAPFETSNVQWSPSLYISRDLSETRKIRLSYSHRIDRPNAEDLNPLVSNSGDQDIFIGNPYLKPSQTQSFEAGYDFTTQPLSYSATLYYRHNTDTITDYSYFITPTVVASTRVNAGDGQSGGLDMSLDAKPTPKFSYSLSADIFYNELSAFVGGVNTHHSGLSYVSKASLSFKPLPSETFQIFVQSSGDTLTSQGTQSGITGVNLSYSHKFSERLKLVMNGNNVLNTAKSDAVISTPVLYDHTRVRFQGQIFYVGLAYKLGAVKGGN